MHTYGDWPDELFWQVEHCASEIGTFCAFWGRLLVLQTKEKFGTARVYCSFGFDTVYGLFFPRRCWIATWWPLRLDIAISRLLAPLLNRFFLPYQWFIYRVAYRRAVRKYPHLYNEIVSAANYGELLEGHIPGYKHSNYWIKVN